MINDLHREKLKRYRISIEEYHSICSLLGRDPEGLEWALFSALWSEHCSYKSSKVYLRMFSSTLNSTVLTAEGENAGIVDLGFGERIVFKMESHNHPSFIEPYQGAATGVGGILRDIFTMGARPIALADYLCFGDAQAPRRGELVNGVVKGISGYGNCVGVPTVSGQTEFDSSYNQNILVNAMAVGLLRPGEEIALSVAKGVGNWVVYVGARTGKDGVHGAAMASESFDQDLEKKKPNVQIGDPFYEKLLIESCFEVLQKKLVVAIQDMGAAGLTSSSFEMASKGRVGMDIDLSQVPLRDLTMTPEEIMLSESQERMLLICEPDKFPEILKVFGRWGLDAVKIGQLTGGDQVRLFWKGELLVDIDPRLLVENAPRYDRSFLAWQQLNRVNDSELPEYKLSADEIKSMALQVLSSDLVSARKPIFRQYDQRVGGMTAAGAEQSVALLRLPDSHRGLGVAVGCRPRLMRMDAKLGALDAAIYPILQMAVKGIRALALTDCLNFGNPEKIEIMSEFVVSVESLVQVSRMLSAPVISGNVSFYNETMGHNITSTPAIGAIGIREHVNALASDQFRGNGNPVYLLSYSGVKTFGFWDELKAPVGQGRLMSNRSQSKFSGELDLSQVRELQELLLELGMSSSLVSSRMVGGGGLLVALLKSGLGSAGFVLSDKYSMSDLISEKLYQALFTIELNHQDDFLRKAKRAEALGFCLEQVGVTQDLDPESWLRLGTISFGRQEMLDRHQNGYLKFMSSEQQSEMKR